MITYLYYGILLFYTLVLCFLLAAYIFKKPPGGDASVGWAIGFFYMAGLAVVILLAWLLKSVPGIGIAVLSFPIVFLALPRIRHTWTNLYARMPARMNIPLLTLRIENHTKAMVHVKFDCWFGKANSHSAQLYTTLDYYLEPMAQTEFPLTAYQTGLLGDKSKYVGIMIYERIRQQYEDESYITEIQPCMQFQEEPIDVFRSGKYTLVIDEGGNTETFRQEVEILKQSKRYETGVF